MLIETPYKQDDVLTLKLSSGEELVGRLVEETDTRLVIKKPMMIVMGQQGIGLAPFVFTSQPETISLDKSKVMCWMKSDKEFSNQYITNTTGIQLGGVNDIA